MVFETNGSDPLSVRGSLPILSHLARKKTYGHYRWRDSDPSEFVRNMRSNKALNLREAFAEMERRLGHDPEGSIEEAEEEIIFKCTVGVSTQQPHYNSRKKFPGISTHPVVFFNDSLQLGLFSTCIESRSSDYGEQCIGWVDFESSVSVYDFGISLIAKEYSIKFSNKILDIAREKGISFNIERRGDSGFLYYVCGEIGLSIVFTN